jgi:spermidine/putrescine transport system ATP-binding protein
LAGGQVELVKLTKRFADTTAVDNVSLRIDAGEFFSLLGPSGCGKTTTLRIIAGFEFPSEGSVFLDGVDVAGRPPNRRNVNTVFQSYALFPFLDVAGNVSFGLRYTSLSKQEARKRVGDILELVQLTGFEKRKPAQLSGGQQQRVALARALVLNPSVLLLDEPLGALDAKLRRELQVELKAIQETVGITFVYVTHDQEEALTMSDRLGVMRDGRVAQLGTPHEVYDAPCDAYVANFLGVSNLMDASVVSPGSNGAAATVRIGDFSLLAEAGDTSAFGAVKIAIRPERVQLRPFDDSSPNRVPAMVERTVFVGPTTQVIVRLAPGFRVTALLPPGGDRVEYVQGSAVSAILPSSSVRVLPSDRVADAGAPSGPESGGLSGSGPDVPQVRPSSAYGLGSDQGGRVGNPAS